MRRVVITGMGLVTPLGVGTGHVWSSLLAGKSGAKRITEFDVSDSPARSPAWSRAAPRLASRILTSGWSPRSSARSTTSSSMRWRADQAISDSGWSAKTEDERVRAGVLIGSGIGGLQGIEQASLLLHEKGPRRISPFFIPGRLINLSGGYVSIKTASKAPITPWSRRVRPAHTPSATPRASLRSTMLT